MRFDNDTPLVSILTPSFEQGAFIADALHSVACQTYPRVEHIVADGGSRDGTLSILEAAGGAVTWISQPDRGQSDAVNKAFGLCRGEIVGWLNSDDAYFDCGVIERVVRCFHENPSADVVYGHAVRVDANGRIVWILWTPRFKYGLMKRMNFLVQPTVFVRRSSLPDKLVDESFDFAMDWELWLRLGRTSRFVRVSSVLAADRHHSARKNKTAIDTFKEDEQRLVEMYGVGLPSRWMWDLYHRFYSLRQRLAGGFYIGRVARAQLAFKGGIESQRALWRRQVLVRRAKWAPEDREAW